MDEAQVDFLSEVLNIGLGRAGAVLSEMSGSRVNMTVPSLTVCDPGDLPEHLRMFGREEVLTVTQGFNGILSGEVILVLSVFSGKILSHRLFSGVVSQDQLDEEMPSAVTELGNIVINHFVGSWSKIFCDQFRFDVPSFHQGLLEPLLEERTLQQQTRGTELRAIFAEAHLDIPEFFVMASLVTLFQREALERLVGSVAQAQKA